MNGKELKKEIDIRKAELHDLVHELNLEPNKDRGLEILNRMILLSREISELEKINDKRIENQFKKCKELIVTKIKNIFK